MISEADILSTTYGDLCTITRKTGPVKDPDTRQSRQSTVIIGTDIPCALSTPSGGKLQFSGGYGGYNSGYKLFCRPEVDIRAGDRIFVTTKAGQSYSLWAGKPFTYAGSHTDTPLSEDEPA